MVLNILKNFKFNKIKNKNKKSAGLALEDNILKYIEIERLSFSKIKILRYLNAPLDTDCVFKDEILKPELLYNGFKLLVKKSVVPAAIGLPSKNAFIKNIKYPDMSLDEVRQALTFELDDYFPELKQYLQYDDYKLNAENTVYDIVYIKNINNCGTENFNFIAAAANARIIDGILNAAEKAGLHVKAIEPSSIALSRALNFIELNNLNNLNLNAGYETAFGLALRDFI